MTLPKIDEIDDVSIASLRRKSPAERIQMAAEANETARLIVAGGIRHRHPEWSERRVQEEVARRMLSAAD